MRTNVIIDDALLEQAMASGGFRTKKSAIENGLKLLVQICNQKKIKKLKGKIKWEGNLEDMRRD